MQEVLKDNKCCIKFLEDIIWHNQIESPYDKNSKVYKCKDGWYKCKNTGREFNVLTGTILQGTKIKLLTWFKIIYREHSDKGGLAATTIMRDYHITYSAAWYMLQKVRYAMSFENFSRLKNHVEMDEYYAGGSIKNKHHNKKLEAKQKPNQGKQLLFGAVERKGDMVIRKIPDKTDSTLAACACVYSELGATIYTDENPSYNKLPHERNAHYSVNHKEGKYVDKENPQNHTNTIESCWAEFKRMESTHNKISHTHIQNYANEVVFRHNTRECEPINVMIHLLLNLQGTRITRKEIIKGTYNQYFKQRVA